MVFDEQSRVDPELDGEGLMTGETLGYLGKTLRSWNIELWFVLMIYRLKSAFVKLWWEIDGRYQNDQMEENIDRREYC